MLSFKEFYQANFGKPVPIYLESDRKKYLRDWFQLAQAIERVPNGSYQRLVIEGIIREGYKIETMTILVRELREAESDHAGAMRPLLGDEYDAILGTPLVPKKV